MRLFELDSTQQPMASGQQPGAALNTAQNALSGSLSNGDAAAQQQQQSPIDKQKQRTAIQNQIRGLQQQIAALNKQLASIR